MARSKWIFLGVFVIILVISAGCIAPQKSSSTDSSTGSSTGSATPVTKTKTPTPTPTPSFGTVTVKSTPYGAEVYLEGTFVGRTSYTFTNVTNGKVMNITLKMEGYAPYKTTIRAVGGKDTPVSGSLSKSQAKIAFENLVAVSTGPCIFDFRGYVKNTGDLPAQGVLLTLTMTPAKVDSEKGYIKTSYPQTLGTVGPGETRYFGFNNIHAACGGEYTATVKFEGVQTDPYSSSTKDTKLSGSGTFK